MKPLNSGKQRAKRVLVVGLDGLEPRIAEPMIAGGELPHLARLAEQGGYARVATTDPAQTPVAWSTFATGVNPGGHGIFDFLRRDPKTYLPQLALNRYEQKNPFVPPRVVNLRRAETIWEVLSAAGVPSVVLRCPCTYPPDEIRGRMLSGMGVPDVRGSLGTSTWYTSGDGIEPQEAENVVHVESANGAAIRTYLPGPLSPKTGRPVPLQLVIEPASDRARVVIRAEGGADCLEVHRGRWSDWLKVRFKLGLLQSVRGMVRFYLVRTAPVFELYASPVNYDPYAPLFPISSPPGYAGELADEFGDFYTMGMPEDHNGLVNGRIDETAFLDQCEQVLREREAMMFRELERFDEGLFFCLFDTPDRIHHLFWRFGEPEHPANRAHGTGPFDQVIREHYRRCDAIIGKVLDCVDEETLLIVLSDHGCGSFRRGVHLNAWMHDQGLLALRKGIKPGKEAGDMLRNVDWSRTKAYAVGLCGIYLNLRGREAEGIVDPEEADSLKQAIAGALAGLRDPESGCPAVRGVVTREEIYRGPYADESPDLVPHFADGYRASWETALGGVPQGRFQDNTRRWAGDHIVDPALTPGLLVMNRPFRGSSARLLDLAPTILAALGVPKASQMEGEELLP